MKLQNSKPGETPDERIVRCATNLMKAVIAAGYNVCSTDGISGFDVDVYKNYPDEIYIRNILSWLIS